MSYNNWKAALKPKVNGFRNLHELLFKLSNFYYRNTRVNPISFLILLSFNYTTAALCKADTPTPNPSSKV